MSRSILSELETSSDESIASTNTNVIIIQDPPVTQTLSSPEPSAEDAHETAVSTLEYARRKTPFGGQTRRARRRTQQKVLNRPPKAIREMIGRPKN